MNQQSWYPKRQMVFATPVFFLPLPPVTILLIELHHPGTVESQPWIQMKYLIYVCYVVIQFGVYRLIGSFKDLLLISRCRPPCLPGPSAVSKIQAMCIYSSWSYCGKEFYSHHVSWQSSCLLAGSTHTAVTSLQSGSLHNIRSPSWRLCDPGVLVTGSDMGDFQSGALCLMWKAQ